MFLILAKTATTGGHLKSHKYVIPFGSAVLTSRYRQSNMQTHLDNNNIIYTPLHIHTYSNNKS